MELTVWVLRLRYLHFRAKVTFFRPRLFAARIWLFELVARPFRCASREWLLFPALPVAYRY